MHLLSSNFYRTIFPAKRKKDCNCLLLKYLYLLLEPLLYSQPGLVQKNIDVRPNRENTI